MSASSGYGDYCGANDGDGDCREQWVAIFGGGYKSNANPNDTDFGPDSSDPNWTLRSKSIYVVALDTGTLLAKVAYDGSDATLSQMNYSLPGSPSGRARMARASAEKSVMYGATRSTRLARPSRGIAATMSHSPRPRTAPRAIASAGTALR